MSASEPKADDLKVTSHGDTEAGGEKASIGAGTTVVRGIDTSHVQPGADEAYEKKIVIMNQALIDIGMNAFQWKIFATTGFGWFLDNFWLQAITIIQPRVAAEFQVSRQAYLTIAKYVGLVVGSTLWPMTSDYIGRRLAFNVTLLIACVAGLVGGGMPDFVGIAIMCAIVGVGTGGNQPVDSAIFLEFVPATHQFLLVMQSAFWSLGQAFAALIAWPLIANYSCVSKSDCTFENNLGWRYTYWTFGSITLVMFVVRFCMGLYETPKFLLGKGRNEEAVKVVHAVAQQDGKESWLTVEHFDAIDAQVARPETDETAARTVWRRGMSKWSTDKIAALFSTPKMALSTTLMLFLWCSIGMAFPLYNSFIPVYFEQKGVAYGSTSLNQTYRNYAIQAVCGIPASIIGGFTVEMPRIGRKGTGTLACVLTGVFLFLFTLAKTPGQVLGFSCAIAVTQNLVYGLLYSYTPELFPAQIRGTGNGLVALLNRLSGLMAPFIATYVGIDNSTPIWISASLFIFAGIVFLFLPYESRGRAAS